MRISPRLELYRPPLRCGPGAGRFTGRWTPPPPEPEGLAAAWGRAIAVGLFVVVLTLWQFYQFVALEDGPACDRLGRAAQALADLDRLWVAAFLVALVLGVCGYSFSRLFPRRHRPLRPLSRHHAWRFGVSPVLFQFFVGIFFFGMTFRISSAFLAATMSAGPAPWWVMHVPWLSAGAVPRFDPSTPFYRELGGMVFLAGILAALWAVGFAVHTLRLLGGRWGPAAVVLLLLVAAAWAVPALDLTSRLPSPIPAGILDGIDDSPALARLLASSSEPPAGAVRDARIFLDSRRVRRARRESDRDRYRNNCEECLLPRTVFLAPEGIRVRIRGGAVEASSPTAVLEIPRGGHEIRFLDPATAGIRRRIPAARLGTECPGGDWVVLRADGKLSSRPPGRPARRPQPPRLAPSRTPFMPRRVGPLTLLPPPLRRPAHPPRRAHYTDQPIPRAPHTSGFLRPKPLTSRFLAGENGNSHRSRGDYDEPTHRRNIGLSRTVDYLLYVLKAK